MTAERHTAAGKALTDLVLETFRLNGRLLVSGDRLIAGLGLTSARWQVLGAVHFAPAPQPVSWLARSMGLNRQGVQRIVVGFPAGGSIDVVARRLAESWRARTGATTVVESRVGAGGRIALTALKDAPPDGQMLVLSPSSMLTIYPHVYKRLQYKPATDFTPVAPVALSTCGFMVGPKVPESVRTLRQFSDWCKGRPEPEGYASPAAGAMPQN